MAIKVGGTTVIDDSRNIQNVGVITATTINATTITGDGSGLTGAGSTVTNDTSTNAAFYPVLTQTTAGIITSSRVSTTKLSFNPSTGTLSATKFSGDGSGLTGAGSTVADDTSTNSTFYPVFTSTTTGTITASKVSTTKLSFNPSTGTLSATTFSGPLSGNATTASTLQTSRNIDGVPFNGSADITIPADATLTLGNYLTGGSYNWSSSVTVDVDATSANTDSKVVARDASGNFSAGTITATLSGNASSMSTFLTTRTINGYNFTGGVDIESNPATGAYSNGYGGRTVTTSSPSGGSNGDIWIQY